jgi:serine/threonine-protein kinase
VPLVAAAPRDLEPALAHLEPDPAPPARTGGGAVKAVLLVAALAVLAAGAWFGGLIPH